MLTARLGNGIIIIQNKLNLHDTKRRVMSVLSKSIYSV